MKKLFKAMITLLLALAMVFTLAMPAMADEAAAATKLTSSQVKAITPTGVKAASYTYSKIKVTWNKIDGVDGYVVYRATSKTGTYTKAYSTSNPDKLYYINTGRTTGKTYYYKIRGYRKINGKTYYTKYSAVTYTYARPNKVKINEAYGCGYSLINVTLDWNAVTGATGYEQQVNQKINGVWTGWRTYTYDRFGLKTNFETYATLLAAQKKEFPSGYIERIVGEDANGIPIFKKVTVEESVAMSISKTQAWLNIVQDDSTYKFRVRAYRTVNGKKVYGAWSDEYTLKETLNAAEIKAALEVYAEEYAKDNNLKFKIYSEDMQEGITGENGSFTVNGDFGGFSIYAKQEDVIAFFKDKVERYVSKNGTGAADYYAFIYIGRYAPGAPMGMAYNDGEEYCYYIWMLY